MRRLALAFTIIAMLASAVPIAADDGERGSNDDQRDGRRVFGPYASGSTDSGTCGNDWANDTFDRFFRVTRNADGSYTLREDFRDGMFTTVAGRSPGGCEASTPHGATVRAGVQGEFSGFLTGPVIGGTFQAAGGCPAPCTGTKFVALHFGATASWNVISFRFRYHADDEDGLHYTYWQNASPDLGGNLGDIAD